MTVRFMPTAPIKLVIWDLDDTFWTGTLSEGGITLVDANVEIVRTLAERGIMSSIVSKNDLDPVRQVLAAAGIWDLFIFPKVSWNAKGGQIAEILDQANLRPDNVLFIDDNAINVEEVRFRFPKMMVAYPQDVLSTLLSTDAAMGKSDPAHTRLQQYKQLERKVADAAESDLSNIDFLRQSEIRLRFEFDIDGHFDRIVELINRSNQLNYTKVRLETEEPLATFREQLERHDVFAAGVFARDKYGSHGLIGFYMQHRNERTNRLLHYVWSCRMMNAGLEQYVHERLGCPEVEVVGPVSNPIRVFDAVDWVAEEQSDGADPSAAAPRLLLLGSCDLTAVASYCSPNRSEYVNGVKRGVMTRYDDFGFILGDASAITASTALPALPAWEADHFIAFHRDLAASQILIVSLSAAMKGHHLITHDGVVVRIHPEGLGHEVDYDPGAPYLRDATFHDLSPAQKFDLLARAIDLIDRGAAAAQHKFLLGANTRDRAGANGSAMGAEGIALARQYNEACRALCAARPHWQFVSIDDVVSDEKLIDDRHYTRMGYLDIANHIKASMAASPVEVSKADTAPTCEPKPLIDLVRAGRRLSRLATFGNRPSSQFSILKQAVKLTPISRVLRRMRA